MRGTTNKNARGSSRDRAARKAWLLKAYESDVVGHCRCYRCGELLNVGRCLGRSVEWDDKCQPITVDRIVPGCKGGKYVRSNIRPACAQCNSETGGGVRR